MTVTSIIVQNGVIVGATIEVNGTLKKARITDLKKLCTLKKITSGCKLINNEIYFDSAVMNNIFPQETFEFDHYDYNADGKAEQAVLTNGQQVDLDSLWKLAADHRISNVTAAYNRITESRILQTAH